MPVIKSKLPSIGTSIFTVMSAMATEHGAINLGQGFPDFDMDAALAERATKAIRDGYNQYAPMPGYLPLRESISEKVFRLYGNAISPDEITITPGGTYCIYTALTAIMEPGDEVIVLEPAFDSYIPNIIANGGIPICIPLQFPNYTIDWDKVRAAIGPKTKAIIVNTPHNPTGSIVSENDMLILQEMLRDTNVFLITDEVYEHLVFDNKQHHSVLKYPELYARSFACFTFGKVYNCTGWKLGYCIAPPALTSEFRKLHQFNCFCCFTPTQVALAEHLKDPEPYLRLSGFMQAKRDLFVHHMQGSGFDLLPCSGSYFICGTYSRVSDESAMNLAVSLTKKIGVATIPVSSLYHDGHDDKVLRFCFAKKEETLIEAAKRLQSFG